MKKIFRKNPYLKKILLALITVNLVPTLFLGASLFNLVRQQKRNLDQNLISIGYNQMKQTENRFQQLEQALIELSLEQDTASLLRTELIPGNFQVFNRMKARLQRIVNGFSDLDDVLILNQNKEWVVGTAVCTSIEEYGNEEKLKELFAMEPSSFWYTDSQFIYLVKHLPIHTVPGTGMVTARLYRTAARLDDQYHQAGHSMVVLDENGSFVYGNDDFYTVVQEGMYSSQWKKQKGTSTIRTRFQKEDYILTVQESEYNGWIYVLVTPNSVFVKSLNHVFVMLGILITGMLCVDGYVIYAGSRNLYMPIYELDSMMEAASPEHNLELVDKVKYLLNQNRQMQKNSEMQKISTQQLYLRKLYRGEEKEIREEDFLEYRIADRRLNGMNMYMIAIKFKENFPSQEDWNLYLFALNNIIEELLDQKERFPLVTIGRIIYVVYYLDANSTESADLRVQSVATLCIRAAREYLGIIINIGISRCFHQVDQMGQASQECQKALRDVMGFAGVCNFYQYKQDTEGAKLQSQAGQERKKMIQAIDMGDYDGLRRSLDDYLKMLQSMKYYRFKLEISRLLSDVIGIYETYALTPDAERIEDIIEYDIGKKVSSVESLKDCLLQDLIQPLFFHIHENKDQNDVIYQITRYLNDNLEQNINLDECARYFNYNSNYLSRMFKKNFGKTYTDYVTEKKIQRCQELLLKTEISVNELAERFGYSSAQNFIRVFKKYTLVTPGQFRKNNLTEEREPAKDNRRETERELKYKNRRETEQEYGNESAKETGNEGDH